MLFLDLDGCFADFAGAATSQINKHLRAYNKHTGNALVDSKTLRKCLRSLTALGVEEINPISLTHQNISVAEDILPRLTDDEIKRRKVLRRLVMWVANQRGFFLDLPVMNSRLLLEIERSKLPFAFLSAPMNNSYCVREKRVWIQNKIITQFDFSEYRGSLFLPAKHKCWLANRDSVLFDDKPETVRAWVDAGGTAFLCPHEQSEFLEFIGSGNSDDVDVDVD